VRLRSPWLPAILAVLLAACERAPEPDPKLPIRLVTTREMLDTGLPAALVAASGLDVRVELAGPDAPADLALLPGDDGWLFATTRLVLAGPPEPKASYGEYNYDIGSHAPNDDWAIAADAERLFFEIGLSGKPVVTCAEPPWIAQREQQLLKRMHKEIRHSSTVEARGSLTEKLRSASEQEAYAITDLATFVRERGSLQLALVMARDPRFRVDYRVECRSPAARELFDWLASARCRALIREFRIHGKRIFFLPEEPFPVALWGRVDPPPFPEEEY